MVFQEPMTSLNPVLTIGRQLTETLEVHLHMSKEAAKARAIEVLNFGRYPRCGASFIPVSPPIQWRDAPTGHDRYGLEL